MIAHKHDACDQISLLAKACKSLLLPIMTDGYDD